MPKTNRRDRPGARHHVMNRGIAKRTCFPDLAAKRRFLGLLACAARRGDLIIEAYSILDTHFHLMVRSTEVGLSKAMMRVLNAYVRYFNRRFRRDGSLFRGRFRSILVDSIEYAIRLLRYIDRNPVVARMCDHPVQYPAGSARFYARSSRRPLWLERAAVERWITSIHRRRLFEPSDYARWIGPWRWLPRARRRTPAVQ
ncbi:MAG: transposase [Planctomycetota bacterium]|nr:transposase [Planctomycetota bacterium]